MKKHTKKCTKHKHNQNSNQKQGNIETSDNQARHSPAIVLAIDIDYRKHEQVGVDECDNAAEADAAVPKHRSQRNIAHGTNERKDGDNWPDDWSPNLCGDWM